MTGVHRPLAELDADLDWIRASPSVTGRLEMIVRRPAVDEREVLERGVLDLDDGLVGDGWRERPSSRRPDRSAHPDAQIAIMNARAIAVIAPDRARWPLAGDQLFVDLDLSADNLPAGTRLRIGLTELEVTSLPHTGCRKFAERFGIDALRFLSTAEGKRLKLRGIYARVVAPGEIRAGATVERIARPVSSVATAEREERPARP